MVRIDRTLVGLAIGLISASLITYAFSPGSPVDNASADNSRSLSKPPIQLTQGHSGENDDQRRNQGLFRQRIRHRLKQHFKARQETRLPAVEGFVEHRITVQDRLRWFMTYEGAQPRKSNPTIIVALHGGTQSMRKIMSQGANQQWKTIAQQEGLLLLVPNGTHLETGSTDTDYQSWNDLRNEGDRGEHQNDDVAFILQMLDWAEETYKLETPNIFVTGASNGGMMTMRLLAEASTRFNGGAAFIAALPDESIPLPTPDKPVPILLANGTEDPLVLWEGGQVAQNRSKTRSVEETVRWWVKQNQSEATPKLSSLPNQNPDDQCEIDHRYYPSSTKAQLSAPVDFYVFRGAGHSIPSQRFLVPQNRLTQRILGLQCQELEGAQLAWDFFQSL